jgi:hypothetical protein
MSTNKPTPEQENGSLFDRLQQGTTYMRECPLCMQEYRSPNAEALFEEEQVTMVHITCQSCFGKVLSIIAQSAIGMTTVGLFTDLTAEDVIRFYDKEPIDEDQLISFHQLLHKKSKRFTHLFST